MRHELSTAPGFEGVATGVRIIDFVGNRSALPHLFSVCYPDEGESWDCLLTVPGRPPLCLKCKTAGHVRKNCKSPYCRHCQVFGHTSEACSADRAGKSYAKATRVGGRDNLPYPGDTTDTDDDEDETGKLGASPTLGRVGTGNTPVQARPSERSGAAASVSQGVANRTDDDAPGGHAPTTTTTTKTTNTDTTLGLHSELATDETDNSDRAAWQEVRHKQRREKRKTTVVQKSLHTGGGQP